MCAVFVKPRPFGRRSCRFVELLDRYPDVSVGQLAEMIETFPHLPAAEIAIMSICEKSHRKLDKFIMEQSEALSRPWLNSGLLIIIAISFVVFLYWLN